MTALKEYNRLESEGLWRPPEDNQDADQIVQRQEVIVSLGKATLILSDKNNVALSHWSLSAIHRVNPKQRPAIFSPSQDSSEILELEEDIIIDAIEKITKAIERSRPKPGRVRYVIFGIIASAITAVSVFWLPDALVNHTASVLPQPKRIEIGNAILGYVSKDIGQPCREPQALLALNKLSTRLSADDKITMSVFSNLSDDTNHLPGGIILVSQGMIEKDDDPSVVSGYILAEKLRMQNTDPIKVLLRDVGVFATFKLLTTGNISPETLQEYAKHFVKTQQETISNADLLALFQATRIRSTPYAYAVDPTGETTLELVEADPFATQKPDPILKDGDWISLQGICEN